MSPCSCLSGNMWSVLWCWKLSVRAFEKKMGEMLWEEMCKVSVTSTRGCAGNVGRLTSYLFQRWWCLKTRQELCSGRQFRHQHKDGDSVIVPLSLPCHRPSLTSKCLCTAPPVEAPTSYTFTESQPMVAPKPKCSSLTSQEVSAQQDSPEVPMGTMYTQGHKPLPLGVQRGDKSIFGLCLCTCIIQWLS